MGKLSHFDESAASRMVDVGQKAISQRTARASGLVRMSASTLTLIFDKKAVKGRRFRSQPHRWNHGGKADGRTDPALPHAAAESVAIDFSKVDDSTLRIEQRPRSKPRPGSKWRLLQPFRSPRSRSTTCAKVSIAALLSARFSSKKSRAAELANGGDLSD